MLPQRGQDQLFPLRTPAPRRSEDAADAICGPSAAPPARHCARPASAPYTPCAGRHHERHGEAARAASFRRQARLRRGSEPLPSQPREFDWETSGSSPRRAAAEPSPLGPRTAFAVYPIGENEGSPCELAIVCVLRGRAGHHGLCSATASTRAQRRRFAPEGSHYASVYDVASS